MSRFARVQESDDEQFARELKSDRIQRADSIFEQRRKLFNAVPEDYFAAVKRRRKVKPVEVCV
jgi:hypothetical protein